MIDQVQDPRNQLIQYSRANRSQVEDQSRLIATERKWELLEPEKVRAEINACDAEAIGLGQEVCPLCDKRNYVYPLYLGTSTGLIVTRNVRCPCNFWRGFYPELNRNVPPHDRFVDLKTLSPSENSQLPLEVQKKLIEGLRNNPDRGYAFFGPAGTSKTTFAVAIYCHVLSKHLRKVGHLTPPSIWRVSVKTLLDEYVAYATGNGLDGKSAPRPMVDRRKISAAAAAGFKPRLFLEEIDKVKFTEFKENALFELIDAVYENKGQLVFNTNLSPSNFAQLFSSESSGAIARRIGEMCEVKDFYVSYE